MEQLISSAQEDYLETVYGLSLLSETVRSVDVATAMDVSKASVNKAVGILRAAGLIEQALYGTITLTPLGREYALRVVKRHTILKLFLTQVLDIEEKVAEEEACKIEHIISQDTMSKLMVFLEKYLAARK